MPDRKRLVRTFIVDNLLFGDDAGLEDDTPFFAEGIVDSTGFLELVLFIDRFLEGKFAKSGPPVGLTS